VVTILSKDFLKLVFASLLIAIPIAWLTASKWLESYPYRIALSWWMFAIAGIIVALVAVTTVGFHAVRAAMSNPVKSLRAE
jgi:putative ABC transport system permease protein